MNSDDTIPNSEIAIRSIFSTCIALGQVSSGEVCSGDTIPNLCLG